MRMQARRWWAVLGLVLASGFLSGGYCASRGYYTPGGTGTSSAQMASGPLSRFGSVFIDGAEYATTAATVSVDGISTSVATLRVGQVVVMSGTSGSGTSAGQAACLVATTKVVGPVSARDLAAGTVTVLGQTVRITGDTSVGEGIAPTELGGLLLGQLVAVDGYRTSSGLIASRLDAASASLLRIAGRVASLSGASQTFLLSGTTVNYAGVAGGLVPAITNGSYVVASGGSVTGSATLVAQTVTLQKEATAGASGSSGTLHGAVTRFASPADFEVAGQAVSTGVATVYSGGLATDIALDTEVEVAGQYDAAGVLAATAVGLVPASVFRVVGNVDRIDTAAATFTVAGVALANASGTRWDDRSAVLMRTIAYGDLRIGDWVEVRGVSTGVATANARVVERRTLPASPLTELQDIVAGLADPALTLAGVAVDTRNAVFANVDGVALTRAQFYAVASGHVVRVRGTLTAGGAIVASTVALRD
jgi:hypothetical protein